MRLHLSIFQKKKKQRVSTQRIGDACITVSSPSKSTDDGDKLDLKSHHCDLCEFASPQRMRLNKHIKEVHGRLRPFKCEFCNYTASEKLQIAKHVKSMHRKEKPYKCNECDYSAVAKSTLSAHLRVHREKPYKCDLCDHAATSEKTLRIHIAACHHNKTERVVRSDTGEGW